MMNQFEEPNRIVTSNIIQQRDTHPSYNSSPDERFTNVSPISNITDKINMGLNQPRAFNRGSHRNEKPFSGQENNQNLLYLPQIPEQKNVMLEFKSRLENVELEFDEAKSEIERLKKRKGELEQAELDRKTEVDRLNCLNQELNKNYHFELEKVSNLNEVILNLRSELKMGGQKSSQLTLAASKLDQANETIRELKEKVEQLEEVGDRKNLIVEKWKSTLLTLTERIAKIEEDNTYFEQERELVKSTLTHVKKLKLANVYFNL